MGRTKRIKAERRERRLTTEAKQARRRYWRRWWAAMAALALTVAFIIPAVYHASGLHWFDQHKEQAMSTTHVTMVTDKGTIQLELYPDKAPNTVAHITDLIKKGFYNGLTFHRVVPGFVVQGGDPKGDGTGGSGNQIKFEKNDLKHDKGVIAMARAQDLNSADSQFYITLEAQHSLDGQYVVFGKVTNGMDVVEKIAQGDKMTSVTIAP